MNAKAFFGFMFFVVIVVTLFVVAITLARSNSRQANEDTIALADYINTDSIASYTVRGRIVADENHNGYKITVSQNARNIEVYNGYTNKVIASKTYPNNAEAYEEFVYALDRRGFEGIDDSNLLGICPLGRLYTYEFKESGEQIARQWVTSCGSASRRNFSPDTLFQTQIPDFNELVNSVQL